MAKTLISMNECVFCTKFGDSSPASREWFDTELTSLDDFIVVPALGPFFEGYLMIVTRQHYHCMGQLSSMELSRLGALKDEVRNVLERCYGIPVVVFEHGSGLPADSGGSCVDHAHFQVLPLRFDVLSPLRKQFPVRPIRTLRALSMFSDRSKAYLFFEDQKGDMYATEAENVPSQYVRRLIAMELGAPEQWDYALFPNYELIAATVRKLRPWPIQARR